MFYNTYVVSFFIVGGFIRDINGKAVFVFYVCLL